MPPESGEVGLRVLLPRACTAPVAAAEPAFDEQSTIADAPVQPPLSSPSPRTQLPRTLHCSGCCHRADRPGGPGCGNCGTGDA